MRSTPENRPAALVVGTTLLLNYLMRVRRHLFAGAETHTSARARETYRDRAMKCSTGMIQSTCPLGALWAHYNAANTRISLVVTL
jgi:uncharacterized membrane protein